MFERFTDRARRVVVLAQEEARLRDHGYSGTEHILLGIVHEGSGIAGRALESLEISLPRVRIEVEEIIGRGGSAPVGNVPFTPRAKKVLELSLREAVTLGHNYIGTEHILLGLIREGEGVGAKVLVESGADLETTRARVLDLLADKEGRPPDESGLHRFQTPVEIGVWQLVPRDVAPEEASMRRCSFCGRAAGSIETLVITPRASICGECLERARRLGAGEEDPD